MTRPGRKATRLTRRVRAVNSLHEREGTCRSPPCSEVDKLVPRYQAQYSKRQGTETSPRRDRRDEGSGVQPLHVTVGSKRGRHEPEVIDVDDDQCNTALKRPRGGP